MLYRVAYIQTACAIVKKQHPKFASMAPLKFRVMALYIRDKTDKSIKRQRYHATFRIQFVCAPAFFYWLGKIKFGRSLTSVDVYTISKFKSC